MGTPKRNAIVLSGGGARGAYEAGVVAGIVEVLGGKKRSRAPFSLFTGTSVGAINAAWLAAHADESDMCVEGLLDHWRTLDLEKHLAIDPLRFIAGAWRPRFGRWGEDDDEHLGRSLLAPDALEDLVTSSIPYERLHRNIRSGTVKGLVVAALEIATARTTMFAELADGVELIPSKDRRRKVKLSDIDARHVLASAAIPMLFPARRIGAEFYCDGGVRFNTPIAPAIRMGADKLVVISLLFPVEEVAERDVSIRRENVGAYPSPIFLLGKVLNALLLDPVRYDLQVLSRFNELIGTLDDALTIEERARVDAVITRTRGLPYRTLDTLVFRPSEDIGRLAHDHASEVSGRSLRTLMISRIAGLGASVEADLLSFIFFDGEFASALAELGRHDAVSRADEIERFFRE